ncbi:tannase and feruloyl esterase-domain-containing protein [Pseudoneurospora amorphoporcata]|uniref:Carboxylic ester hydrolase n=1 Tax=Pseudoneurospora amorphoporcata TaxID=241081 RepID=A0AAN6NQ90_9PEZI|nr:tannase and feruloyl esterase-domain-containing protein [Pseudoneurospora amorphoporcata]
MDREWADSHIASQPKSRLSYLTTAMLAVAFSAVLYALLISNSLAELGGGSLRQRQTPRCLTSSFTNVLPRWLIPPHNDKLELEDSHGASFAGGINWPGMSEGAHYGFATISTDNGHNSAGSDLSWATPARLHDWGYRALHGSVVVGKLLVAHYYSNSPTYSYYAGCSTGGRQGLREIQYDANSFDGVLIGAPAWDTMHLMPWISKIAAQQLSTTANGRLRATQLSILGTEVLRQCDAQDGVRDNIISQPDQCRFDMSKIMCSDPSRCLTRAQADTASKIWSDYTAPLGLWRPRAGLAAEDVTRAGDRPKSVWGRVVGAWTFGRCRV